MPSTARLARSRAPLCLIAALTLGTAITAAQAQTQPQQRPAQRPAQQPQQQQPQQPAQPPAQPQGQAGQQQNNGPTVVQVKPEPSQPEWTKVCGKDPSNQSEICYTTRDFVSDQGQAVLAAAVYDVKGGGPQQGKIVRFLMPLGLLLKPGIRFAVDTGQATPGQYALCFPNGCFAEAPVRDDTINAMKRGTTMNVSVQNQVGREVTFAVPLAGFGKAFDGPAIDPKVLEQQQKQLQEQLQKNADDMRKRLEQGGANAGAAATPPAAGTAPTLPAPARP